MEGGREGRREEVEGGEDTLPVDIVFPRIVEGDGNDDLAENDNDEKTLLVRHKH